MTARTARCFAIAAAIGVAAFTSLAIVAARAQDVLGETGVKGAGSTFVYPVLAKWSQEYRAAQARGGDFPIPNAGLEGSGIAAKLGYVPLPDQLVQQVKTYWSKTLPGGGS